MAEVDIRLIPDLDMAFDVGPRIDGAIGLGSAMLVGGPASYIAFWHDGVNGYISNQLIGNLRIASASGGIYLEAVGIIRIRPSNDPDDFIEFYTAANETYIQRISGTQIILDADGASIDLLIGHATKDGNLDIYDNANRVRLTASPTLAADYQIVLPPDDGDADECLITNGAGVTDWRSTVHVGWEFIEEQTGAGPVQDIEFTTNIQGSRDHVYMLTWNIRTSANINLGIQFRTAAGWCVGVADYSYVGFYGSAGWHGAISAAAATFIEIVNGSGVNMNNNGHAIISYNELTGMPMVTYTMEMQRDLFTVNGGGQQIANAADIIGIRIHGSAANIINYQVQLFRAKLT